MHLLGVVAIPEVPVLAYIAIGLLALVGWLVMRGLLASYENTFGFLLQQLASVLRFPLPFGKHVDLGGPVRKLDNSIMHALSSGAAALEHGAGYLFHGVAVLQLWAFRELYALAHDVLQLGEHLVHRVIPRSTHIITTIVKAPAHLLRLIDSRIAATVPHLLKTVRVYVHGASTVITQHVVVPHLGELQWIHRHWRALTATIAAAGAFAIPGALPWKGIEHGVRDLAHWRPHVNRRLARLERLLGATGLAIALANVLGLPNWRCLTRGNLGRVSRVLCGLDSLLLNALIAGLLVIESPLSIEELAHEYLAAFDEVFGLVKAGVREIEAL